MLPAPSASVAYVLVAHGSRDVRSQSALTHLAELFRQSLAQEQRYAPVATATLEFNGPLAAQIQEFGAQLRDQQIQEIKILPLFLLSGAHVNRDLPEAVAAAQAALDPMVTLCSHLGAHPCLPDLLRQRLATASSCHWILMAHGSRYPGGNQAISHLAARLQVTPAFWAVSPSLDTTVARLVGQGQQKIGIFPYFLFTGSITDAIMANVNQLRLRFTKQEFTLISPLEATPAIARLLLTLI